MIENQFERSGGVFCSICGKCLASPRKRKYFKKSDYMPCEECLNLTSSPALCNTDPKYHNQTIAKILMEHDAFSPELCDELGRFMANLLSK